MVMRRNVRQIVSAGSSGLGATPHAGYFVDRSAFPLSDALFVTAFVG